MELAVISVILLNLFSVFCVSGTVLGTSIVSSSDSLDYHGCMSYAHEVIEA